MDSHQDVAMQMDELLPALRAHLVISCLPCASTSPESTCAVSSDTNKTASFVSEEKQTTAENTAAPAEEGSAADSPRLATEPYNRWSVQPESSIDYGVFSATKPSNVAGTKGHYITTAINYTNGPAHMGHAYEAATADALARYYRLKYGPEHCYFVTGADEHGQKIANTAGDQGVQPIDLCDKYVAGFQCLNQRILISNNDYIRTTSPRHKRTAQALWTRCSDAGDIYLSTYSGWYNIREETFVTDLDAQMADFMDVTSGMPLKRVEEESYFFKMSKYHDRLVQYIQEHDEFIQPEHYRKSILTRLLGDRLRDLSISRTSFEWGIPVLQQDDETSPNGHVMYVWFDALSNYLTGVDGLGVNDDDASDDDSKLAAFWPADVHIIGKDILWFHTVIWPCILMSANIPLPKTVFAHGFVNDKDGKKMSKSLGNVVDPHDMLDKYSVDTFRWYLCKEAPYGGELAFSEESMRIMHNADLCDTLGNLVHRATNLCKKECGGVIPDVAPPTTPVIDFDLYRTAFVSKMDNFELEAGASLAMQAFRDVNGWLTEMAPWHLKDEEEADERKRIVRATLEAIYALAHLLVQFIPNGATTIFEKIHTPPVTLMALRSDLRNLVAGTVVDVGDVLYNKIQSEEELSAAEATKNKAESYADAQKRKKDKKAQEIAASKAGQNAPFTAPGDDDQSEFTKVDIRVGRIVKVWLHEKADKLFCEEIDVGEESGPRQIASGLREHYELGDMLDRKVLVVCNLKAAKIVGFTSNGMVLAAKNENGSKVELICPPNGAPIGERVFIDGLNGEPLSSAQMKKKKTWESVVKGLKTGKDGVATWEEKEIRTTAGVCSAASLVDASIS